jgi:hypothetical protein
VSDTLRDTIIARAQLLGLTAYAIAKRCSGEQTPDPDTVKRYLSGRVSLNSRYVSQMCDVLGLELRQKPEDDRAPIGFCKDCKHWGDDATTAVHSHRMRFCKGLTAITEPHPEIHDGSWIYQIDSAMPEPVEVPCYGEVEPRFAVGPEFGCVKFESGEKTPASGRTRRVSKRSQT